VKIVEAGTTSQGRSMIYALVSSPENLGKIDRYREIARRLAHPQGLTDADAKKARARRQGLRPHRRRTALDRGRGLVAHPQLLYDIVSKTGDRDTKAMLGNVVLMLWPTINPDGQQMVAEWYMKNVGTPYELSGLPRSIRSTSATTTTATPTC
jgi:hypothetical protein